MQKAWAEERSAYTFAGPKDNLHIAENVIAEHIQVKLWKVIFPHVPHVLLGSWSWLSQAGKASEWGALVWCTAC